MIYMTPQEAQDRLQDRYGIESALYIGDLLGASEELRNMQPFRSDVDLDNPPDALLDWVALKAYQLATYETPASSESIGDIAISYATTVTQTDKRLERLAAPYLAYKGRVS